MADAIGQAWAWQGDDRLGVTGAGAALDAVTLEQVRGVWDRYIMQGSPTRFSLSKGQAGTGGVE